MTSRTLFAGPFIGEFGHEVLGTGLLRARAREYDEVVVCSRPDREALYEDIATEFRAHKIDCIGQADHATAETQPEPCAVMKYVKTDCDRFVMRDCGYPPTGERILKDGIYHKLGKAADKWAGVVVFHARNRPHQTERNWPLSHWRDIGKWLRAEGIAKRVVCVGTREQARKVRGCEDMRGSPLSEQMDIAASALCAVGPSSGWMHLASLCECPHLTWVGGTERGYVKQRYVASWNPLHTPAHVLDEKTWQPSFRTVRGALAKFVEDVA